MSAVASRDQNEVVICKSGLSDSFLLYLIKESSKAENIKPYEHQYLKNNKVNNTNFGVFEPDESHPDNRPITEGKLRSLSGILVFDSRKLMLNKKNRS